MHHLISKSPRTLGVYRMGSLLFWLVDNSPRTLGVYIINPPDLRVAPCPRRLHNQSSRLTTASCPRRLQNKFAESQATNDTSRALGVYRMDLLESRTTSDAPHDLSVYRMDLLGVYKINSPKFQAIDDTPRGLGIRRINSFLF
jgi:hypothetical protein